MASFFLVLECLNEIWAKFDFFAPTMLLYDRQGRKHGQFDDSLTQKYSIYSQYFALNSQCEACSFSVCDRMKHTFSFNRVSLKKSWNMRAKTEDVDAWYCKVDQFAVVTGNVINYHLTSGGHESFYLVIYASHACRSGRMLAGLA